MKITIMHRCSGKTSLLVKEAKLMDIPIIVYSNGAKEYIKSTFGYDLVYTAKEFVEAKMKFKNVLVDEIDLVLDVLLGGTNIVNSTYTGELDIRL